MRKAAALAAAAVLLAALAGLYAARPGATVRVEIPPASARGRPPSCSRARRSCTRSSRSGCS
ncbi:MAG: hypothetical protein M0D55_11370 [Elusimicrobiota bacterium]|nr:MAG: hypothetical protein M0D55_11370 [Elusimicrobiota bacterium]